MMMLIVQPLKVPVSLTWKSKNKPSTSELAIIYNNLRRKQTKDVSILFEGVCVGSS